MKHDEGSSSAASDRGAGRGRGLLRRAFATRGARSRFKGSGTPSYSRKPVALIAVLTVIASLVFAASASAAPTVVSGPVISDVSYSSAHVEGVFNPGGFAFYKFEYSIDNETWTSSPEAEGSAFGSADELAKADLKNLKGGTHYFVRLSASNFLGESDQSDPPNPDFTTLPVAPPIIVSTDDAFDVFSKSATATGEVERPAGDDTAFDVTSCRFEYVTDADFTATGFSGAGKADCEGFTPITTPNGKQKVTAHLSGLKAATTYHLRLAAENASPDPAAKEAANTFTTLSLVAKPIVIAANDATDVSYFTAKVSGEVQRPEGTDPALDTSCRFEYVTDTDFGVTGFDNAGKADCVEATPEAPLTGTDPTPVSAELTGLEDATTYHLRLTAENGGGTTSKDAATTFTTLTNIDPVLEIHPILPADVGYTTAHVTGTIDRGEPERTINWDIQIFTEPNPPEDPASICCGQAPGKVNEYSKDFENLKPGTTYYVRFIGLDIVDGNPAGFRFSPQPYESFTTRGTTDPPIASLDPVTDFTATSAHFTGTVDPKAPAEALTDEGKAAYKTKWHIECTPECKDINGNEIGGTVEGDAGPQPIAGDVKRLDPNTEHEVKLIAENVNGAVESVQSFKTPLIKPTVKAAPGGSDGKGGYTLQGTVNPNGSPVSDCHFEWGPNSNELVFSADCSPMPGDKAKPVTVEAHLTGLNPGAHYHFNLFATNEAGEEELDSVQEFVPTLDSAPSCPNEQIRRENNSLALPECRAYEKVTPSGKEGFGASLADFSSSGRVLYESGAGNLVKSGQNALNNQYVAARTATGWETIPNLNGSSGSLFDAPSYVTSDGALPTAYSEDLLSSIWRTNREGGPSGKNFYLRNPDGTFTLVGLVEWFSSCTGAMLTSADLSHIVVGPETICGATQWGQGAYEYVGTGVDQPRRVDFDNSGNPVTACTYPVRAPGAPGGNVRIEFMSEDGQAIFFTAAGGCGGDNPPADEIWARVNGTTSFQVSASRCNRDASDLGGLCNPPAPVYFLDAAKDGSRVFFFTSQQLVDGDTDGSDDIYACDLPTGVPAPMETANPCLSLREVSGATSEAQLEKSIDTEGTPSLPGATVSADGSTVAFVAQRVLAENEDAFGEQPLAGNHNFYAWRTDTAHPDGQTTFVGRLESNDLNVFPQTTPDGRYLVFTTASRLLDTDTDNARDVYHYDIVARKLTRASTNIFGVAGNGPGLDAGITGESAVSDDGQKIVFTTTEALSSVDGNGEPDAYLWTPARVSLITTGAVRGGVGNEPNSLAVAVGGTGQDIYFQTPAALTPSDGDDSLDVYDARVGGGFSFAQAIPCSDEACRPLPSTRPTTPTPDANLPKPNGNVVSKTCPKRKVAKGRKCVKKRKKRHRKKKSRGRNGRNASHNSRGSK